MIFNENKIWGVTFFFFFFFSIKLCYLPTELSDNFNDEIFNFFFFLQTQCCGSHSLVNLLWWLSRLLYFWLEGYCGAEPTGLSQAVYFLLTICYLKDKTSAAVTCQARGIDLKEVDRNLGRLQLLTSGNIPLLRLLPIMVIIRRTHHGPREVVHHVLVVKWFILPSSLRKGSKTPRNRLFRSDGRDMKWTMRVRQMSWTMICSR